MSDGARQGASKKELRRIPQAVELRRAASFHRSLIGMTGAWIARLRHAEVKYMAARHLWEWAEQFNALRKRLLELPGTKPDAPLEDHLNSVIEEALFASDEEPFLETLYSVFLPGLCCAYKDYIHLTVELPDRPSVRILKEIINALDKQMVEGSAMLQQIRDEDNVCSGESDVSQWVMHIRSLLHIAGGVCGITGVESVETKRRFAGYTYQPPERQHRSVNSYFSYEHPIEGYLWSQNLKGNPLIERAALAVWLYNELDAAEYISPILYEVKGMPWEFYYDVARHTWDEARHSEFGLKLMTALGFSPEEFEVWVATYMSSIQMKPHERYAAVTCWYEPGSFQVKPDYLERLASEAGGTDLAVELLRFDLADETLHVAFGHKWVEQLMRHYGDFRTVNEFVDDVKRIGISLREKQAAAFTRTMPHQQRHNLESIKRHMEQWMLEKGKVIPVSTARE